jgi:hypothetical protein
MGGMSFKIVLKNEFKGELESRMLRLELEGAKAELSQLRASRTGPVRSLWATSSPEEIEPDLCSASHGLTTSRRS